jgi:hypothetical protein
MNMGMLVSGALVMACAAVGLHFLRFWSSTRDGFFLYFAVSFWLQGAQWLHSGWVGPDSEYGPIPYVVRLVAYGLIVVAIVRKNYAGRGRTPAARP